MNAPKSVEALSGPVSGMDTSSVAGVPCSQAGSHTGGLTPLESELLEALRAIVKPNGYDVGGKDGLNLERARDAIAKAEATATEAQHAGQWRPIESAPRDGMMILGAFRWDDDYTQDAWLDMIYWESGKWELVCECATTMSRLQGNYTHWQPLPPPPPAAPPSPAPPSSEREGSRAGDRS